MRCFYGLLGVCIAALLTACTGGAVVFAPTPLPPDVSPIRYEHPGGAFALSVPRHWSVFEQNTTTLASASFAPPDSAEPLLTAAVIRLGAPVEVGEFGEVMNAYQTLHRPDLTRYIEQDRQAMGDGSWRLAGVRTLPGGTRQQVNTFIQYSGAFVGVIDLVVPQTTAGITEMQNAINTFQLLTENALQPAELSALGFVRRAALDVVNVAAWANPQGVFFITGEVANFGNTPVADVPISAALLSANGAVLIEAADVVMGYSIPPGGFAPFSLRFGQGQPPESVGYRVAVGGQWNSPTRIIYGAGTLTWTDASTFTPDNHLLITGTVTNESTQTIRDPLALVTVFDAEQNVIAAWFAPLGVASLAPEETVNFEVRVMEIGGEPVNYILEIQGLGEEEG